MGVVFNVREGREGPFEILEWEAKLTEEGLVLFYSIEDRVGVAVSGTKIDDVGYSRARYFWISGVS